MDETGREADPSIRISEPRRDIDGGEPDADGRAFAFLALDQQLPAMTVDDVLDDRQSKAGATHGAGTSLIDTVEPLG